MIVSPVGNVGAILPALKAGRLVTQLVRRDGVAVLVHRDGEDQRDEKDDRLTDLI